MKNLAWTLLFLFPLQAQALSITDSFTSRVYFGSSTIVWNQSLGELHPTVFIEDWDDGTVKDTDFSVGDGSHGSFTSATDYANFSDGGDVSGQIIRINTDTYSNLQFTNFNLQSGWTIQPTGSNPLIIRSLAGMTIDGDIDCSGGDGSDATSDETEVIAGGISRCGSGAGGSSENIGTAGGPSVTGGGAGGTGGVTGGIGGGGGGGYSVTLGDAGEDPNVGGADDGGVLGTRFLDDGFDDDVDGSGSGGGGGSRFDDAGDPANHSSGAGGGAGGGSVQLYAMQDVNIGATSTISVNGGAGGNVGGTLKAGAGGGGAGGSVLVFTKGDIAVAGTVTALGGSGGASPSVANGGDGSTGRTWLVGEFGDPVVTGTLNPTSNLSNRGDSRYRTGAFTATSSAIDMGNTGPTPTAISFTDDLQGGTVGLQVAFGETADDPALSSFAAPATYLNAQQERFVKYQFTVNSVSDTTPTRVLDLTFTFDGRKETDFDFTSACGRVSPPNGSSEIFFLLFLLPLVAVSLFRFRFT